MSFAPSLQYFPRDWYSVYRNWTKSTTLRLIFENTVYRVHVLRFDNMCRFGKGWTEFTIGSQVAEGDTIELVMTEANTLVVQLLT